ncbi:hypothetical protein MZO42_15480 [Sphingomonas psychrotolerans]|uniref:Uncharacterized protein n=1 Tax=Sphingomonas psychrotolerans TaxID=1327635 RepID=A0ABU3N731_9SPHN|nr:hypothetical protein [Sphingomonas psychrotolerans]MDT8760101.1 hypothetical protein [Sphingomonas psychrotolerans]
MMDKIAKAIANIVIFLEYSSEDDINEDCAIKVMEQIAGDLGELDSQSRRDLCKSFRSIASIYDGEIRSFVSQLPSELGLEESEDDIT